MRAQHKTTDIAQHSDKRLLAMCLQQRESVETVDTMAQDLLERFGSLHGVFGASANEIFTVKGMGPQRYAKIQAMQEVQARILKQPVERHPQLNSCEVVVNFVQTKLQHESHECFAVLFLDNQYGYIHYERIFQGTINQAAVYPRVLVRKAVDCNAAAVILAHNHPSGAVEPSEADLRITRNIIDALALVDVKVVDHLIIGAGKYVSFLQRGLI